MAFLLCSTLLPSCPAAMAVRISARPSVTTVCFPLGWFMAVSFEPVTLKVRRNASQDCRKDFAFRRLDCRLGKIMLPSKLLGKRHPTTFGLPRADVADCRLYL